MSLISQFGKVEDIFFFLPRLVLLGHYLSLLAQIFVTLFLGSYSPNLMIVPVSMDYISWVQELEQIMRGQFYNPQTYSYLV